MLETHSLTQSDTGSPSSSYTSGTTTDEGDNDNDEDEERGQRMPLLTETDATAITYGGETTGLGNKIFIPSLVYVRT